MRGLGRRRTSLNGIACWHTCLHRAWRSGIGTVSRGVSFFAGIAEKLSWRRIRLLLRGSTLGQPALYRIRTALHLQASLPICLDLRAPAEPRHVCKVPPRPVRNGFCCGCPTKGPPSHAFPVRSASSFRPVSIPPALRVIQHPCRPHVTGGCCSSRAWRTWG